jgi:hypothetical protein
MIAVKRGYTSIINALIEAGADVNAANSNGKTALHCTRKLEIIDLLCRYGASVDIPYNGITLLQYACIAGNSDLTKSLLRYGADPEPKEPNVLKRYDNYERYLEFLRQSITEMGGINRVREANRKWFNSLTDKQQMLVINGKIQGAKPRNIPHARNLVEMVRRSETGKRLE